ncbi:MAG: SagB/ThcOx family dehydrogenase [Gemmatimonadetes bacterium]|nr:SagB/ThcOx family dehydrogenase [Gemmatimonadota bacterium]
MPSPLPDPRTSGTHPLEDAIHARRSVREFQSDPLGEHDISQLLWAAQGITGDQGYRAAPSAGAFYPLETYVITADGVHHYLVETHSLERVAEGDLRAAVRAVSFDQACITSAPVVFLFTAVYERTCREYGGRGRMYVHMDVGHAAQNLLLQAEALGLAGVPVAAFDPADLSRILSLPEEEEPVYLVPIGKPA